MAKLIPSNRHLLVQKIQHEKKEQSYVLVPDDYNKVEEPYGIYEVLGFAKDCKLKFHAGDTVVLLNSMVEEIGVVEEKFFIVLENHVVGFLDTFGD